MNRFKCWMIAVVCFSSCSLQAADPQECDQISLSDVGWTDITMTTSMARLILGELGYGTQVKRLSVPDTYKELASGKLDVFLGNWMPAQSSLINPYLESGEIETLQINLASVRFTLAVLQSAYDAGLRDFADIHRFKDQLSGQIIGIEPGSKGNEIVKELIRSNTFNLQGFTLVESYEKGMINNVERLQKLDKLAVFLAWEPHPMNDRFRMQYLSGGDKYFGPNYGASHVATVSRKNFANQCPNAAQLFKNMRFTIEAENQWMGEEMDGNSNRRRVVMNWLMSNPQVLRQWMLGVTRRDGSPVNGIFNN